MNPRMLHRSASACIHLPRLLRLRGEIWQVRSNHMNTINPCFVALLEVRVPKCPPPPVPEMQTGGRKFRKALHRILSVMGSLREPLIWGTDNSAFLRPP